MNTIKQKNKNKNKNKNKKKVLEETEHESDGLSSDTRSRSRSQSPMDELRSRSASERRRSKKKTRKERRSLESGAAIMKAKEFVMVAPSSPMKRPAGEDRMKLGTKEMYVVCQDLRGGIKKIKKETPDEEAAAVAMKGTSCVGEMDVDVCNVTDDKAILVELEKANNGLRSFVLDDSNKITKWSAACILSQASKYDRIIKNLLQENAKLRGQLQATNQPSELSLSSVDAKVSTLSEKIDSICDRLNSPDVFNSQPMIRNESAKSYALIVRGAEGDLSSEEVKKRMAVEFQNNLNVRVKAVRSVRNGGVVIETASQAERSRVAQHAGLRDAGLRVEEPNKLDPRIVLYDVPNSMTENELMGGICEKNFDVSQARLFRDRAKIVRRLTREGNDFGRVIVQLPLDCQQTILKQRRVYVGWTSYKANKWEQIVRCFGCMSFAHTIKDCKSAKLCHRCGKAGHEIKTCNSQENCVNCQARGSDSRHSVWQCPEYERRLQMLRTRINNG